MKRIAAIVVCYHPDRELLRANIGAFADEVDTILVWRNSPESLEWLKEDFPNVIFLGNGENAFIARPLNEALRYCADNGHEWLLTMDQDSHWDNFKGFIESVSNMKNAESVGLFAPNVNWFSQPTDIEFKDIEWVIQSGMLLNLNALRDIAEFREDYQSYGVDEEFCYWLNHNNKKVRILPSFNLSQKYGNPTKSKFGFTVYNYSPLVRYFTIRNMLWMKREFPDSTTARRICSVIAHNTRDIIFAENHKFKKLSKMTKGIIHGLFKSIRKREHA